MESFPLINTVILEKFMLKFESEIKIRAAEPSRFIKKFNEAIGRDFQYLFSKVYVGSEKIEFENTPLSFLMIWNFYEIIKNAVIFISPKKKTISIAYSIDFSSYLIFWCITSLLIVAIELLNGINDLLILFLPLLWCGIAFLFTMISQMKFRGKVLEAVKMSDGKVITY